MTAPYEIACDESGYEGEKLIGSTTDVFAHARVRLTHEAAADFMRELHRRIRSPVTEYKANHILRDKHRAVLRWALDPAGPLHGSASAFLIDKAWYVLSRAVDLLVPGMPVPRGGRELYGDAAWHAFLLATNNLLWTKDLTGTAAASYFAALPPVVDGDVLGGLRTCRAAAEEFRRHPTVVLEPLVTAITQAVTDVAPPVVVVHDQTNTLSPSRIAGLVSSLPGLAGIRLVDSLDDARVRVADVVAGVARKLASDELNGRGDAELIPLLRPFVDAGSIWGDERSWSALGTGIPAAPSNPA